ncbi:calsequestrin-1-like [Helianthus annuus]|uniref:calsequestrin-1-like n=1 Tax=Helianthus annuus TaxID=4232 RepID=UPI000B90523C|nr:calsequestrin-1-like [Helianthus annuus]KAJ0473182.1 putative DNA-directed RNA polymerase III, subunit Rpc31 [Helianthus annuus]
MAYGQKGRGKKFDRPRAKEETYEIYPEIKEFPDVNLKQKEDFSKLISWGDALRRFWVSSPYYLEAAGQDSERNIRKPPLSDFMKVTDGYVPAELVTRNARRSNKKVRWDPQSDLQRLDLFERLDQGPQGQDDVKKEKKEDEDDDDEEDIENIEDEEEDSDDYNQNIDFDDDEDVFNMDDDLDGDEGGYY